MTLSEIIKSLVISDFINSSCSTFKHVPLYLEWAPVGVFNKDPPASADAGSESTNQTVKGSAKTSADSGNESDDAVHNPGCILFVKNLNFNTTEQKLKKHFTTCGTVVNATVARKRDPKNPGNSLSMGYGFVQFIEKEMAQTALKELQHSSLDNHNLELKVSERTSRTPAVTNRKKADGSKIQRTTKILVRNIPFQANKKEVSELFKVFGELKLIRLPMKIGGQHRGFAFVDFITKNDAKRAFEALCHSTHLYGRRLVLEWADSAEESVETLRRKTADGFTSDQASKKFKKSSVQEALDKVELEEDDK